MNGKFSTGWKKTDVLSIHKTGDQQVVKSYCRISILPNWNKVYGRLDFFIGKYLLLTLSLKILTISLKLEVSLLIEVSMRVHSIN